MHVKCHNTFAFFIPPTQDFQGLRYDERGTGLLFFTG